MTNQNSLSASDLDSGTMVPSSSPDGGFPVISRKVRVPSLPVKRYPAGIFISAMSPSLAAAGPSVQAILGWFDCWLDSSLRSSAFPRPAAASVSPSRARPQNAPRLEICIVISSALRSNFAEDAAFVNVSVKQTLTAADFSLLAVRVGPAPSPHEVAKQEENS